MRKGECCEGKTFVVVSTTLLHKGGVRRTNYAKRKNIYGSMGENVAIQSRIVPLYSELIRFHNNIVIARNVDFCTHDVIHSVLRKIPQNDFQFEEHIGCIEIMDNVFVGSNSVILYGTRIGPNVIIASGSVVVKDCEPDSVYAGVPARKVGSFQEYVKKRITNERGALISTTTHNQALTKDEIEHAWELFYKKHS